MTSFSFLAVFSRAAFAAYLPAMTDSNFKTPVEALHRGLRILEFLSSDLSGQGRSLASVSEHMCLRRSTVHNLLKTLCLCGYARNLGSGVYVPGWKLHRLSREAQLRGFKRDQVMHILGALAKTLGESLVFAALVDGRRMVIARASCAQDIQVNILLLEPLEVPLWRTVTGRVLAAYCLAEEREQILAREGLPGRLWQAIASREELDMHLGQLRQDGYVREVAGEVFSAAVPVLNRKKELLGALGVFLPMFRYVHEREKELLEKMALSAKELAEGLQSDS